MKRLRALTCLVLAIYCPVALTGCAATHWTAGVEIELNVPLIGKLKVTVVIDHNGEKVYKVSNPTGNDACVQPRDANGNKIGGPLELPAGGSVELPPGADSDKSDFIKKPKKAKPVEPKPIGTGLSRRTAGPEPDAIVIQPLVTWPGLITSFSASGQSKVSEYEIGAADAGGAFAALDKLGQGLTVPNAELVARSEFVPTSFTAAQFSTAMPAKKISQFAVYVDGVLVASSATGLGGATIRYSSDGYGYGTASIPFNLTSTSAAIEWVTTDNLGVPTSRSYSFHP